MTTRLREALHRAAEDVPTYRVYERALATARRSRWKTAAAGAAVLVLCTLAVVWLPTPPAAQPPGTPTEARAALPDRIGLPVIGALHVTDRPRLGPAAVLFSGQGAGLSGWDEDGVVGVVGAGADRYRVFEVGYEAPAGEQVLLSPDGRHIAYPAGPAGGPYVEIIDLVSGGARRLASAVPGSVATRPVGWSRDGRRLVVNDLVPDVGAGGQDALGQPAHREQPGGGGSVLSIVELGSGHWIRVRTNAPGTGTWWSVVAFAPDQRRLAYQIGSSVMVTDLDGQPVSSFALAPETALAGKGAWTPDGTALTVAARQGDVWMLRYVDPATGEERAGPATPAVSGVTTIRLLGWGPDGSALVVAYQPEPRSPTRFDQPLPMDQRTAYGNVRTVRVLALTPGDAAPTTLLTAPEQVLAIDVADNVVASGHTRKADPPYGVGPRFWLWTGLALAIAVGIAVILRGRRLRRGGAD